MKFRIIRDDGLIIARGIDSALQAMVEASKLKGLNRKHDYKIADDADNTIQINVKR